MTNTKMVGRQSN